MTCCQRRDNLNEAMLTLMKKKDNTHTHLLMVVDLQDLFTH